MTMSPPYVLLFGPQTKLPTQAQAEEIRDALLTNPALRTLLHSLEDLLSFWKVLVSFDPALEIVPGHQSIDILLQWLKGDWTATFPMENNCLCTTITVIAQVVQYFNFLNQSSQKHGDAIAGATSGSIQGFCTGFLSAVAISVSQDEEEINIYASKAIKLALAIGAYIDLDRYATSSRTACLVVRSKASNSIEDLPRMLEQWELAYISVIYDQETVTVTVSKRDVSDLTDALLERGFVVKDLAMEGRFHSKTNNHALEKITTLANTHDCVTLPDATALRRPLRTNMDGLVVTQGPLSVIAASVMLTEISDWHKTLSQAIRIAAPEPHVVIFGFVDIVPASIQRHSQLQLSRAWTKYSEQVPEIPTSYPEDAVAIVGMSARYAGVESLEEFWDVIASGQSMCTSVPPGRWPTSHLRRSKPGSDFYGNFLRDVKSFDHRFFKKSSKEAAAMDPQQRLLLEASYEALESSGYFAEENPPDDIGCFIGVATTDYHDNIASHSATAFSALGELRAFLCGRISYHYGWTGPSTTFDTACSASMVAIDSACRAIQTGQCSRALAGGVSANSSPNLWENLRAAGFLSPTGPTKPFDEKADGYCRGEGVGLVVLKKLSEALLENDFILAVVSATGLNQAKNETYITVPHGPSQAKLYKSVIQKSGLDPDMFTYVEAHGTGTQKGDPAEMESIRSVFSTGTRTNTLQIGSVKGNIGHCEAASGVASLIKTVLMMQKGCIPPLANHQILNPKIPALESDMLAISREFQPWTASFKAALINNYGAAGSNAALALSQSPCKPRQTLRFAFTKVPIYIAADSEMSLLSYCSVLKDWISRSPGLSATGFLPALAYNLSRKQNRTLRHAIATTVSSVDQLVKSLALMKPNVVEEEKPVVLVFGGQTSSYVNLSRQVYYECTEFRLHLDFCNQEITAQGHRSVFPGIFQRVPVPDIVHLHCMFFAIQYACAKTWMGCGVTPSIIMGHSFGHLTALCTSGVLTIQDTVKLIAGRATLMKGNWGDEAGSMAALEANVTTANQIILDLKKLDLEVEIACYNGKTSQVLVGSAQAISRVEEWCTTSGPRNRPIRCKRLAVTNGFHSRYTESLIPHLGKLTAELNFHEPSIPLETCTKDGSCSRPTPAQIAEHTREPVYFQAAVERIEAQLGPCTWLEAGSASSITTMVRRATTAGVGHSFHPVHLNDEEAMDILAETTATLMKSHRNVIFWPFSKRQHAKYEALNLPPYQFKKTQHWLEWKDYADTPTMNAMPDTQSGNVPTGLLQSLEADLHKARFMVNSRNEVFQALVKGHAVLDQPLCPADLYIDLVHRATLFINPEAASYLPAVENLAIVGPLGIDPSQTIFLDLSRDGETMEWSFSFTSHLLLNGKDEIKHAFGSITLTAPMSSKVSMEFARYQRLLGPSCAVSLLSDPESEGLRGPIIYRLFSKVVTYSSPYQGIQAIASKNNDVAARIVMPPGTCNDDTILDPALIDNFVQVAGIKANCLNPCPSNQVFICGHIGRIQTSHDFLEARKSAQAWNVVAHCTPGGDREHNNDIYVSNDQDQLVMVIFGVKFIRVAIASLTKSLANSNSSCEKANRPETKPSKPDSTPLMRGADPFYSPTSNSRFCSSTRSPSLANSSTFNSRSLTPLTECEAITQPQWEVKEESGMSLQVRLTKIVTEQLETNAILVSNTLLEDHGLDSLLSVELKGEIEDEFSIKLPADAIHSAITFGELISVVNKQTPLTMRLPSAAKANAPHPLAVHMNAVPPIIQDVNHGAKRRPGDRMKTVLFDMAENIRLYADIYLPDQSQICNRVRPVALMIHGGGHTMLSRRDIRPKQTALLIANGFLPVSIDYRLCPEVNIVDGAMRDIVSALRWAREDLPGLDLGVSGLKITGEKIAVIGWSTGGTLALQLGFTSLNAGIKPPDATLVFYCPSNFEDTFWTKPNFPEDTCDKTLEGYDLLEGVYDQPTTSYNIDTGKSAVGGWMSPSDVRSRIVLHMNWRAQMLPIILNGLPSQGQASAQGKDYRDFVDLPQPSSEQVIAISPYSQIVRGNYQTPTFIVHGTKDDLIPWQQAEKTYDALVQQGVCAGLKVVDGAEHLFDLYRSRGREWEVVLEGYDFLFQQLR